MVDQAFDDFLNSDDDDFLLEASNHLLDSDFTSTRKEFKNTSEVSPVNHFEPSPDKDVAEISNKTLSSTCNNVDNANDVAVHTSSNSQHGDKLINTTRSINNEADLMNISILSNKTEKSNTTAVSIHESSNNDAVATASSHCNISTENVNLFKVSTPSSSSYINKRFTPGFTPKAKKQKFLGPAGFLEFFEESKEATSDCTDTIIAVDVDCQNIVSSQYTPEHLLLPSWQKLQTTVSSCPNLHSTAKYYSIQRVLSESSKKKLPKHMVVPVLCVLLKKFNTKGSTIIPIFMDDTGEINGKIDAEVLSKYKEFLVEGTALILKKVTFLCNVLILKDQNLVSLYHPQGTEKHPQSLDSVLETSEPLKPMNCDYLKLSNLKKNTLEALPHYDTSKYVTHSQNGLNSISYQSKRKVSTSHYNNSPKSYKPNCIEPIQDRNKTVLNQNNSTNKRTGETSFKSQNMRSDKFLEQLLDDDNCMDEFDEILGNLDENSFMEDI